MTMTQNDLFSCCQAKTILTHEPVAAPRKKKIPKRRSLCNHLETCHLQSYFRHFSEDPPNKFRPKFAFSKTMYYLCTVNQRECYKGSTGGIYYDQGRSQQTTNAGHLLRPQKSTTPRSTDDIGQPTDTRHKGCNKCPNYFLRSASPADKGPATRIGETTGRTQHINHHLTVIFQSLVIFAFLSTRT